MNYLAEGLSSGFDLGASAYQKKKDREEQARRDKAREDFEKEILGTRLDADMAKANFETDATNTRLNRELDDRRQARVASSTDADMARLDATIEKGKGRSHDVDMLGQTQTFQKPMQDAQIASIGAGTAATRAGMDPNDPITAAKLAQTRAQTDATNLRGPMEAAALGMRDREFDARYHSDDNPSLLGGKQPSGIVNVTSQAQFDSLPKGTRFSWNGRTGTK